MLSKFLRQQMHRHLKKQKGTTDFVIIGLIKFHRPVLIHFYCYYYRNYYQMISDKNHDETGKLSKCYGFN